MFGRNGAVWTHEIEKRDVDHENLYLKVSAKQRSSLFPVPDKFSTLSFLNI